MPANEADCLANYELGEQLAPGVHKAVCRRGRIRGRAVALRMTPATGTELAALEAASALHRTLHHPAVVTLFSAFYDGAHGVFCEVLEFCPGGSLAACAGAGGREKEVLRAVVEALLYLQKERVEHRAVGPGSVLLAEGGRVKLGNFRQARKVGDGTFKSWSQDLCDLADLVEWLLGDTEELTLESRNLVVQLREKNAGQIPLGDVLSHPFFMTTSPRVERKVSSARTVSFAPFVDISGVTGRSTSSQTRLLQDISNLQPIKPRRSTLKTASAKTLLAIITDESKTAEPIRYPLSPPMTDQSTPPTPILPEAESLRDIDQDPKPSSTTITTQHLEALTTSPLEPQVFKLGHGSLAIQQSRALLVDLREGARRKGKKGDEVLLIDKDGHTVHIYGAPHLSVPCVLSEPRAVYALETLPEQHWQAYRFAADFLDAVKRRKSRALFLVEDAQCALMSNGPAGDVEVKFFRERQRLDNKNAQRNAASTRLRVLVSRAKQTVEIASFKEGAMSVKKTCAFRPNAQYGLGRDDERELSEEERACMLLSIKCVALCTAFEGLGFDSTGGAVDGGESDGADEEQDGAAEGISASRSLSVRVEPRPRWSPAMLV